MSNQEESEKTQEYPTHAIGGILELPKWQKPAPKLDEKQERSRKNAVTASLRNIQLVEYFFGIHGKQKLSVHDLSRMFGVSRARVYQLVSRFKDEVQNTSQHSLDTIFATNDINKIRRFSTKRIYKTPLPRQYDPNNPFTASDIATVVNMASCGHTAYAIARTISKASVGTISDLIRDLILRGFLPYKEEKAKTNRRPVYMDALEEYINIPD